VATMQAKAGTEQLAGPVAKQRRSQITYKALIDTGFRLLEDRDFDSISIAEIAKAAGYSVGAFYARFENKEEYFRAMVQRHIDERRVGLEQFFKRTKPEELIAKYVQATVTRIWKNRFFWRASLRRSLDDPSFWDTFRRLSHLAADKIIEAKATSLRRGLTKSEEMNIRFALQIVLGTINNAITNKPGPVMMEHRDFQKRLVDAFCLVSRYNDIR
jgi:AcrR family transcriptional regulator